MVKVKDFLFFNDGSYSLKFGLTVSSVDFDWICGVWDCCDGVGWLPSRCLPILEGFRSTSKGVKVVKVYRSSVNKFCLYLKGFYVGSGSLFDVRDLIKGYYDCGCDDTYIDELYLKVKRQSKKMGLPRYVNYLERSGKYRVSKNIGGKCYYYGQYDDLDVAIHVKDCLIEKGWVKPKPRRNKYNTDKRFRYLQVSSAGSYIIIKDGQHYGTYKNVKDAMEERDWLVENDWSYENIDLY